MYLWNCEFVHVEEYAFSARSLWVVIQTLMKTFLLVLSAYRSQTIEELNTASTASILKFGISLINGATQFFHIKVTFVKAQTRKLQCVKSPRYTTVCLDS